MSTITAANSVYSLAITNLYPSPQTLQGYAADDAFTSEAVEMAETVMGVDGQLSAGFVFNPVKQSISIMPTSPSLTLFENWVLAMKTAREVYPANATIILSAIGKKYTLKNGVLSSAPPHAGVKKTLQPLVYQLTWQSVISEATA